MMEHYKQANDSLHPTRSAIEGAVARAAHQKKRKPLRALVPAGAAVAVAAALLVTGLPNLGGGGPLMTDAYAIAQPVYPELPQHPAEPTVDSEAAWEQFSEDYDAYWNAWRDYQRERPSLADTPELETALENFVGESTTLTMAGEGNRIYSPISLWFALAMLAETTGGDTRQEILDTLGASDVEQLRNWADILWHALYMDDGREATLLGSSIWLNEAVSFHKDVLETLAERYYASSFQVPMGTDEADNALSSWVAEQTRGLIGADGKVMETNQDTLAILASTLYYKARWTNEFNESRTEPDTFTAADGAQTTVDFMHKTQDATFLRQNGYQAASLSTASGEMIFVLPDEGCTPADLLADPDFLAEATNFKAGIWGEVQWSVPKFDVSSSLDLKSTLQGMGITKAFDANQSDFTPLTDVEPVWLAQAKQIARVKVDEKGVEAAAVTLMANAGGAAPPEDPQICIMDLNRPFVFIIQSEGVILFVGVVEQVS